MNMEMMKNLPWSNRNDGQMIQKDYAYDHTNDRIWRRTLDRSDNSVRYEWCEAGHDMSDDCDNTNFDLRVPSIPDNPRFWNLWDDVNNPLCCENCLRIVATSNDIICTHHGTSVCRSCFEENYEYDYSVNDWTLKEKV